MKHHVLLKLLGVLVALFTLLACSEDNPPTTLSSSADTQQIIEAGRVEVDARAGNVNLILDQTRGEWTVSVSGEAGEAVDWCRAVVEQIDDYTTINIPIEANNGMSRRRARLSFASGQHRFEVEVVQRAKLQMRVEQLHVDVGNDGGRLSVVVYTNVEPQISVDGAPWLKEEGAVSRNNADLSQNDSLCRAYYFTAEPNSGLGRAATITFKGEQAGTASVVVHQWPRTFNNEESIHVETAGELGTLLGGDADNWSHIGKLTLSGTLNTTDMQALRHLLSEQVSYAERDKSGRVTWVHAVNLGVRHLDMSDCTLVGRGQDYEEPTITAQFGDTYRVYQDNELADAAFKILRMPLEAIMLPSTLERIGGWAFYYSYHLTRIDIPASVRHIGPYAFAACQSLTHIGLPDDSKLETLGMYAFAPHSKLDEIRFPASLQVDEGPGPLLGGASYGKIHVKWTVPPVLKRLGVVSTATLYVPRGTAEAYRKAAGWNRAAQIIEE